MKVPFSSVQPFHTGAPLAIFCLAALWTRTPPGYGITMTDTHYTWTELPATWEALSHCLAHRSTDLYRQRIWAYGGAADCGEAIVDFRHIRRWRRLELERSEVVFRVGRATLICQSNPCEALKERFFTCKRYLNSNNIGLREIVHNARSAESIGKESHPNGLGTQTHIWDCNSSWLSGLFYNASISSSNT